MYFVPAPISDEPEPVGKLGFVPVSEEEVVATAAACFLVYDFLEYLAGQSLWIVSTCLKFICSCPSCGTLCARCPLLVYWTGVSIFRFVCLQAQY